MWFIPKYILILSVTTLIDYTAAIFIERSEGSKRKFYLIISVVSTCLVLIIFKYLNFLNQNIIELSKLIGFNYPDKIIRIILPIGLSFHTFQSLAYVIEVYFGRQKAEMHFGKYALYVMFFPQLVAGPIERPQNLLPQLYEKKEFSFDKAASGLKLILWGFFKKLVVADRLAIYVNAVYNNSEYHNGLTFIVATFFFCFQVYCDFSAYSDIARGTARIMGYELMLNFNRPFFSRNISEFWRRWHISLITWFRDYVYIPLGGSRVSKSRWYLNILLVWIISGVWHGAGWTYVLWGTFSGIYILIRVWTTSLRNKFWTKTRLNPDALPMHILQVLFTFFLFYSVQFFFRANTTTDAIHILNKVFTSWGTLFIGNPSNFVYSVSGIILLVMVEFMQEYYNEKFLLFENKSVMVRYLSYATVLILIGLFGVFDGSQFIYFQF